MRRVLME